MAVGRPKYLVVSAIDVDGWRLLGMLSSSMAVELRLARRFWWIWPAHVRGEISIAQLFRLSSLEMWREIGAPTRHLIARRANKSSWFYLALMIKGMQRKR